MSQEQVTLGNVDSVQYRTERPREQSKLDGDKGVRFNGSFCSIFTKEKEYGFEFTPGQVQNDVNLARNMEV